MTYPLLPYSQFVYDLRKILPDAYEGHGFLRFRLCDLDSGHLQQALRQVVRHHPVFSMHIDDNGQTPAPIDDELQTQYFRASFSEDETYGYIELTFNRILMDGYSFHILKEDLCRAYNNLPLEKDDYTGYLQAFHRHSQSETYRRHREEMIARYANPAYPLHPHPDTPVESDIPSSEETYLADLHDMGGRIDRIGRKYVLSSDAVVAAAVILAITDYNRTNQAAITWAYADRDSNANARIVGSVHKDIPLTLPRLDDKEILFREMRNQMRFGIAHCDYPITLFSPFNAKWNFAANLIHEPQTDFAGYLPLEPFREDEYSFPTYSLFDILIQDEPCLSLRFRYSATHYKVESVTRFAGLIRDRLMWLTT